MTVNKWTTRKVEVPDGTRIEIWDEIPGKRGWSQKVGRVHFHGDKLHMAKKDVDHIQIHKGPPLRLERGVIQVWRLV